MMIQMTLFKQGLGHSHANPIRALVELIANQTVLDGGLASRGPLYRAPDPAQAPHLA